MAITLGGAESLPGAWAPNTNIKGKNGLIAKKSSTGANALEGTVAAADIPVAVVVKDANPKTETRFIRLVPGTVINGVVAFAAIGIGAKCGPGATTGDDAGKFATNNTATGRFIALSAASAKDDTFNVLVI